jgi:hypothetical protein
MRAGLRERMIRITAGAGLAAIMLFSRLRIFAVTQIAASFLLLAGACVLMKTLFVLEKTRPPFDSPTVVGAH